MPFSVQGASGADADELVPPVLGDDPLGEGEDLDLQRFGSAGVGDFQEVTRADVLVGLGRPAVEQDEAFVRGLAGEGATLEEERVLQKEVEANGGTRPTRILG